MRWARALLKSAATLPLIGRGALDRLDVDEFAYRSKRTLEALCRARVQPVYVGDNEGLCRILGRYKLYVDTSDRGLCAHLMLDGFWEMGLTMHMARRVRAGMVAIDIGANFGYYTILLAALVGDSGRVFAIEPAPKAAALLRRSVELNGFQNFTTIIEVAAGASEGTQHFYVPDREPKNAQIIASCEGADTSAGTLHEVVQSRVDALVGEQTRVDFVKIDAEGAEEAVIAGMLTTLRRDRPQLVLEFNAKRAREPDRLLGTLCDIYGGPCHLDLHGNVHNATIPHLLREQYGVDWLLVFGGR